MVAETTADKITIDLSKIKTVLKVKKINCNLFDFLKVFVLGAVVFLAIFQCYYTVKLYNSNVALQSSLMAIKNVAADQLTLAKNNQDSQKEERIFLFVEDRNKKYGDFLKRYEPIGKQLRESSASYNFWSFSHISFHGKLASNSWTPAQLGLNSGDTIKIE